MTPSERYGIIIAGLGLGVTVLSVGLGLIVRITRRWTQIEDSLHAIANTFKVMADDNGKDHKELSDRINRADARIERHELWHDDHPYLRS